MGLFGGLIQGLSQGLQTHLANRSAEESRQMQMEHDALATLAQSSDNPEIQSAAIAGLMELAQGNRKRSGVLGIGKLTQLPAFQKINEIAQKMGAGKKTPAAAATPPPGPDTGGAPTGGADMGGGIESVISSLLGTGGGPNASMLPGPQPEASMVPEGGAPAPPPPPTGAAAMSPTNLTQSAPTAAAAAAPPPASVVPPSMASAAAVSTPPPGPPDTGAPQYPYPQVPRSAYGTLGPTGGTQIQALVKGEETAKDEAKYRAQIDLERTRQEAREKAAAAKQEAADKAREDQQAARQELEQIRQDRIDNRQQRAQAGLEGRLNKRDEQRDKELQKREDAALKKARSAALTRIDMLSNFPEDHPQHLTQQAALAAKQGVWAEYPPGENEEAPRFMNLPGGVGMIAPSRTRSTAATPPPSAPTAGGPPGPPPDYSQIPQWGKLKSTVEAQRRAGKSPQQILVMAQQAGILPLQLAALKSYLRLP